MKLINYNEASEMLAVKLETLYTMVHRKVIPHVRISPRSVRFDKDELENWLKKRCIKAESWSSREAKYVAKEEE